jgi:hypothetical protein
VTGLIVDLIVHYFANAGSLLERERDLDVPLAMAGDPLQVLQIIAHSMFFLTFFYLISNREPRARIQRVPESVRNRVDLLRQTIRRARLEARGPTPTWFWYGLLLLTAAIFSIGFMFERIA